MLYTRHMTQQKSPDDIQLEMYRMMQQLTERITVIEENMATKQDIDRVMNILDAHTEMLETDEMERLAMSAQVSRHQDWIERADKVLKIKTA